MMKRILWLICIWSVFLCHGQNPALLDSLLQLEADDDFSHDTLRLKNYLAITANFYPINRDSAAHYNQKAYVLSRQVDFRTAELRALNNIGVFHFEQGRYDEADSIYQLVLDQALYAGNQRTAMYAYWNLGNIANTRGDYQAALQQCILAADIARTENDLNVLAQLYINMSIFADELDLTSERRQYALRAVHTGSEISSDYVQANAYSILGNSYFGENLDSAQYYFLRADSILQLRPMPAVFWEVQTGLGHVSYQRGQFTVALSHFRRSNAVPSSNVSHTQRFRTACDLARVFMQLNVRDSADFYFDRFRMLTDSVGQEHFKNDCWEDLAAFYERTGRYREASELYRTLLGNRDALYSEDVQIAVLDLERKYQTAEKERQILEQEVKVSQRTRQRNALLLVAVFMVLLSAIIYYFQKQRLEKNARLAAQDHKLQQQKIAQLENEKKILSMSSMIEGQEAERSRIARDLHDGLGGLLGSIKAHFSTIQNEIKELESLNVSAKVNELIDTASKEVRRISHNMVPHALQMLGLNDALQDICKQTPSNSVNIDYHWSGSTVRLEEHKEIMLYRIVQELLHNAIKYARAENIMVQVNRFDKELNLIVEDDGVGFDFDKALVGGGLGLQSVQSRVSYLQGSMDVDTRTGEGTSYSIQVPL